MSIALVGYTGFVGSNIYEKGKDFITDVYNSKNISEAFGTCPDLLIYSGLRAEKYLANNDPEADMAAIKEAEENIRKIDPEKLVLISTIDVLKDPNGKDEDCIVDTMDLHPYGYDRYQLELWVRKHYPDALIIRLPGLFGKNIKKNFIYDYINVIPFMLKENKFTELSDQDERLKDYYVKQKNGFYKCKELTDEEKILLKQIFQNLNFTALHFTDSRNVYQFYPLDRLWNDIQIALKNDVLLFHPATEPISAGELYTYLTGKEFVNEIVDHPVYYDYRSKYAKLFGGDNGYILNKEELMKKIKEFVNE